MAAVIDVAAVVAVVAAVAVAAYIKSISGTGYADADPFSSVSSLKNMYVTNK